MSSHKPRILLLGAGRFGIKHLETLLNLEKKGRLVLSGVVVNTEKKRKYIEGEYRVPCFLGLSDALLDNVDAVDIVTPPETHAEFIRKCLPKAHVLVEKPLALEGEEAWALKREADHLQKTLMVGHIYRYHAVVMRLKKLLGTMKEKPKLIEVELVNPLANDNGRDVETEFLHPFDIVDYLTEKKLIAKFVEDKGRLKEVSCQFDGGLKGVFTIGWMEHERRRHLNIVLKNKRIVCELEKNLIKVFDRGVLEKEIDCTSSTTPLEREIEAFIASIKGKDAAYPDGEVGARVVEMATKRSPKRFDSGRGMKIAVIGAGIFGTSAAIELSHFGEVTLFEKNDSILSEASMINQYRHHWGYHYPRSQETIDDILGAVHAFEERYQDAIVREFPTYYSIAKEGSKITKEEYIAFCDRNKLPYTIEYPEEQFLNRDKTTTCLKTFEPIYNFGRLKKITQSLLKKNRVALRLNHEIVGARIMGDGKKELSVRVAGTKEIYKEEFDYVVNVTYARHNHFAKWLGFALKPIRLDLVETLWVKLPFPKISIAVMDGNFTNVVPTGRKNIFTLVHIKESVLRRFVPKDGLVPRDIFKSSKRSRVQQTIKKSMEWIPVVKDVKVLKVHYVLRGVNAYREHDDARTSDITTHGFGCFSILGGKIIHSVSTARYIAETIGKSLAPQRQAWAKKTASSVVAPFQREALFKKE